MLSSLAEGSNLPLPTADKAGLSRDRKGAAHWTSEGAICRNPHSVLPAQAAVQYASPHRGRGRPGRRQCRRPGRVRGPLCHSCTSRNPGSFGCAPWCHSREGSSPGPLWPPPCPSCVSRSPVRLSPGGRGPPASLAGCGGDVSFLRKQKSRKKTRIPTFVAVPRKWPPHEAKVFWPERGSQLALFATHPPLWGHAFRSL
jgi:hypothetical protein